MSTIVGISGKARAGKDTFGSFLKDHLASHYSCDSVRMGSFAAKLKEIAKRDFGLSDHQLVYDKEGVDPRWGTNPRTILQKIGTSYRDIYVNYWVDTLIRSVEKNEILLITDMRYRNEYDAVLENGGVVVRIERPEELREAVSNPNHPSETDLDLERFHLVIENNKSLDELKSKAEWFSHQLIGGTFCELQTKRAHHTRLESRL